MVKFLPHPCYFLVYVVCAGLTASPAAPQIGAINALPPSDAPIRQKEVVIPEPYPGMPIAVNPPTFRWPGSTDLPVSLTVATKGGEVVLETGPIDHYFYRPREPLPVGDLEWTLHDRAGGFVAGDQFTIGEHVKKWPVRPAAEALSAIPKSHPRVHVRPENLEDWRAALNESGNREFATLMRRHGDDYRKPLPKEPELPEIEGAPTRDKLPQKVFREASEFGLKAARGVVSSCLLYQATGEEKYAEFVKARALALAALDPRGVTSHDVNDFGNSRIVNALGWAYSWVHDTLTGGERATIRSAILERCRIALLTADANKWPWPSIPLLEYRKVHPHAWQIVNYHLSVGLLAIYGETDEADEWMEWMLELFVANYPWFGGADGGSAEQVAYFLNTNLIPSQKVAHLYKTATEVDLTGNPWHRKAPYFMLYGFGPGGNSSQFGDNAGRAPGGKATMAARHAAYQFQDGILAQYYDHLNEQAAPASSFLSILETPYALPEREALKDLPTSRAFKDVGLVFMRSDLEDSENEIFFEFKSSPHGSIGHGHNDQNSMNLSAYGRTLLLDSGFYDSYRSPHRTGWTQTTRAHNAILMNGTGQPANSTEYFGRIVTFEDEPFHTYVVGDAHRAYDQVRLKRFDRHVLWLKPDIFLIADDIESEAAMNHQFLLHAVNAFEVDGNELHIRNEPAQAKITLVEPKALKITQTDAFHLPLEEIGRHPRRPAPRKQWHLTAETLEASTSQRFITVIEVSKTGEPETTSVQVEVVEGGVSIRTPDGREGTILWRGNAPDSGSP